MFVVKRLSSSLFNSRLTFKQFFLFSVMVLILTMVTGSAYSAEVTLKWDPVSKAAGYKLHYGLESQEYTSCIDVGGQTNFTLSDLEYDTAYYFAISAYNSCGNESDYSIQLIHMVPSPDDGNDGTGEEIDSDQDGISDLDETNIYGTDPDNPDTDGDGVSDGDEIRAGTDPIIVDKDPDENVDNSFAAIADASVDVAQPNANYGSQATLKVGGINEKISYLRFDVKELTGTVVSARIRLTVTNRSTYGGAIYQVSDNNWDEDTLTFNNSPSLDGSFLDEVNAVSVGDVIELDVTSAISGNGTYNFAIVSDDSDRAEYAARENENIAPELIVETKEAIIPPANTEAIIVVPVEDASVNIAQPNANYGSQATLQVGGINEKISYLRFDVKELTNTVVSARIRLTVTNRSSFGGVIYQITDNNWDEDTLTFNNSPSLDGPFLDEVNAVNVGDVIELDVTSAINGNGTYNFAIVSDNSDRTEYASREDEGNAPELIVETE